MNVIGYFLVILTFKAVEMNGDVCLKVNPVVTTNLCGGTTKRAVIGDFNGDGKDDFVCHDSKTGTNVVHYGGLRKSFEPSTSVMKSAWCIGSNSRFLVGDFNGDGRSDFLCHAVDRGYKWISYADKDGKFTGTDWHRNLRWCISGEMHVGDFNGDKRTDMLCHSIQNGYKWISYATTKGEFHKTDWHSSFTKCIGKLHTGDFNGDKRTDILCHEGGSGAKNWISLAGPHNNSVFTRIDWTGQEGWCIYLGGNRILRIGDINGDGLDDVICKDSLSPGHLRYSKNVGRPNFGGTTFLSTFCNSSHSRNFHLADVTGDGKKDFLCINNNGHAQVAVSTCR